jgi:hypothetical protein
VINEAAFADVVIKASGVGVFDDRLIRAWSPQPAGRDQGLLGRRRSRNPRRDHAPAGAPACAERWPPGLRPDLWRRPAGDRRLSSPGRPRLPADLQRARSHDPSSGAEPDRASPRDLNFLGQPPARPGAAGGAVLPGRRLRASRQRRFLLGGSAGATRRCRPMSSSWAMSAPRDHNAFNRSPLAVLNVARDSMAEIGFSPGHARLRNGRRRGLPDHRRLEGPGTVPEAPDEEVLVARDGQDVAEHLRTLTPERARTIGEAARNACWPSIPMRPSGRRCQWTNCCATPATSSAKGAA